MRPSPSLPLSLSHGADAQDNHASVPQKPKLGVDVPDSHASVMLSHGADAQDSHVSARLSQKPGVDAPDNHVNVLLSQRPRPKPGADVQDNLAARTSAQLRPSLRLSPSHGVDAQDNPANVMPKPMFPRLPSRDATWLEELASRPRDSLEILPRLLPRPLRILICSSDPSTSRPVRFPKSLPARLRPGVDVPDNHASAMLRPGADAQDNHAREKLLPRPKLGADAPGNHVNARLSPKLRLGVDVPVNHVSVLLSHGADAPDSHARRSVRRIPKPRPGADAPDNLAVPSSVLLKLLPRRLPSPLRRPGADAPVNHASAKLLLRLRPMLRLGADVPDNLAARPREMRSLWLMLPMLRLRNCKGLHTIA